MRGGYLDWSTRPGDNAFQEPPVIAGVQQDGIGIEPSGEFAGGGVALEMFGGGHVRHYSASHPNAPLSGGLPETLTLSFGEFGALTDFRMIRQVAAQSMLGPIEILMRLEGSDQWQIAAGRSLWTTSFKMGFGTAITALFSPALPTPVVEVLNSANVVQKTLTVVSGAPAAGEVQIDETADSQLLTTFTGDLDANAGERLIVYYVPLLSCAVNPTQWTRPELNILSLQLDLDVTPLKQDWAADTP